MTTPEISAEINQAQLAHELHAKAVHIFSQNSPPSQEAARQALEFVKQSVNILPTAQSLLNTAKILMVLNEPLNAIDWGQQCLAFCANPPPELCTPSSPPFSEVPEAHRLLGQAYAHLAQYTQALPHLQAFYQSAPHDMANEFDLAYAHLALGNYQQGWHHYQVRYRTGFAVSGAQELAKIPAPEWQGNLETLKGKVILLMPEQGFGDEIHFSRVARHLKSAGAKVWIMAPQPLESLMRTLPWKERVVGTHWQAYSEIDCWSTVIRACAHIQLNPYFDPPCSPYLMADPAHLQSFPELAQSAQRPFFLGINWRGNARHFNDKARSMSLADMLNEVSILRESVNELQRPLKFCSLQLSPSPEEVTLMQSNNILDLSDRLHDFSFMAAALSLMDHFVTIDSAPAHLAGALSVKTSLLIPPRIDWRWGTPEKRPPWYSSLTVQMQNRFT